MNREEAIKTLREDYCGNRIICELYPDQCNREDCEIWLAIKALETQPDGDCISRQAAIDAVNQYNFDFPQYMERFVTELMDAMKADLKHDIEALPSAQPEIIMCKDCEHYKKEHGWNCIDYMACAISSIHTVIRKPDDYCSRAKRKE